MKKEGLQIFDYGGKEVRTVKVNGETWFVLTDVCSILELTSPHKIAERLDDDEKGRNTIPTLGGNQEVTVVSESGLYNVILLSRKPEAKAFKRWITHDVLPDIRKHGVYMADSLLEKSIADPDYVIGLLTNYRAEKIARAEAEAEAARLEAENIVMQPKAVYFDEILHSTDTIVITQIAKDYGMTAQELNKLLNSLKIQFFNNDKKQWLLYKEFADMGYVKSRTRLFGRHTAVTTEWTQRGRFFLYDRLKRAGYLPVSERIKHDNVQLRIVEA